MIVPWKVRKHLMNTAEDTTEKEKRLILIDTSSVTQIDFG